jgi:hypothetical protein
MMKSMQRKTPLRVRDVEIGRLRICAVESGPRDVRAFWVYEPFPDHTSIVTRSFGALAIASSVSSSWIK